MDAITPEYAFAPQLDPNTLYKCAVTLANAPENITGAFDETVEAWSEFSETWDDIRYLPEVVR